MSSFQPRQRMQQTLGDAATFCGGTGAELSPPRRASRTAQNRTPVGARDYHRLLRSKRPVEALGA